MSEDLVLFRPGITGATFGDPFIGYFIKLKELEIDRFLSEVTDWQQREYFSIL